MARIAVRVHPRAKKTGITGKSGDFYKLDLRAPPVDAKANDECVIFLAQRAGVPRSHVRIISGLTGRIKIVDINGVSQRELEDKLLQ
jgi:uncharacterized protein (TIGR00251 family)